MSAPVTPPSRAPKTRSRTPVRLAQPLHVVAPFAVCPLTRAARRRERKERTWRFHATWHDKTALLAARPLATVPLADLVARPTRQKELDIKQEQGEPAQSLHAACAQKPAQSLHSVQCERAIEVVEAETQTYMASYQAHVLEYFVECANLDAEDVFRDLPMNLMGYELEPEQLEEAMLEFPEGDDIWMEIEENKVSYDSVRRIADTMGKLFLKDEKPGLGPKSQSHQDDSSIEAEVKVPGVLASPGMPGDPALDHQPGKASKADCRDEPLHEHFIRYNTTAAGSYSGTLQDSAGSARLPLP